MNWDVGTEQVAVTRTRGRVTVERTADKTTAASGAGRTVFEDE